MSHDENNKLYSQEGMQYYHGLLWIDGAGGERTAQFASDAIEIYCG